MKRNPIRAIKLKLAKARLLSVAGVAFYGTCLAGVAAPPEQPGLLKSEFIFEQAPFPSCHASTLAETPFGLVAAWFGGTHERHPDVGIWVSRFQHDRWTPPVEVANGVVSETERYPCWNPVLFQPRIGPLILFYKVGPSPSRWWGMLATSDDGGATWSRPIRLPEGILGPIKNKPIELASGTIICGSSTEGGPGWRVHFELLDWPASWLRLPDLSPGSSIEAIQPCVLVRPGGVLQTLCRTRQGYIAEAFSRDLGRTWSPLMPTPIPNPNSGIDAITLADGRHLLVYNHSATPKVRTPLNVAVSPDGTRWFHTIVLEDEPHAQFSYPAVIQTSDGLVHVTYTWNRLRIKHAVIDPAQLKLAEKLTSVRSR